MTTTTTSTVATPPPTTTPAVSVRELRQSYGEFEAVRGVSFDVAPGNLFALLGTNGAGKTTTIETLEGFRKPTGGQVRTLGIDPYGQPPQLRERVNAVLQHSGLFAELTVAETVDMARDLAASPRGRAEVLELVELSERGTVMVRQLSGGEKRRLDLALALVTRPEVLFLDEPTTGMDPEARRATWTLVEGLVEVGTTVLLTTHYLEEAERLADQLAILHEGEIRVSGTVPEVVAEWGDRITFQLPAHVSVSELPSLPGATCNVEARDRAAWARYTIRSPEGETRFEERTHHALRPLLHWADERELTLERLEVRSASLEDVFLGVAAGAATSTSPIRRPR